VASGGGGTVDSTLVTDKDVLDVRVGYSHICARIGTVTSCWGNGLAFGAGSNISFADRVAIGGSGGGAPLGRFEAGGAHTCWVEQNQLACNGNGGAISNGIISSSNGPLQNVRDIALSHKHGCALTTEGKVYCFGENAYGELGLDPDAGGASSLLAVAVTIPD